MRTIKKVIRNTLLGLIALYVIICGLLYMFQEKLIFLPDKLDKNFKYSFEGNFEEVNIKMQDGAVLNCLLFRADSSKGLIFYLHGNAGSLEKWGKVAETYVPMGYDVFIPDFRSYGKSGGEISSEEQFYSDIQTLYDEIKKKYNEDSIIVLGYSIGTGPASKIASVNSPRMLILQAPYVSLSEMMGERFPVIPTFLLKYEFSNYDNIKLCKMPVVIFHGDNDEVISYGSSIKLKESFKPQDTLITLKGQGHNGMTYNEDYVNEIGKVLMEKN